MSTPTISIMRHRFIRTITDDSSYTGLSMQAVTFDHRVTETITATFTVNDAPVEPMPGGRTKRRHIIKHVTVKFDSVNGSVWETSFYDRGTYATGAGVLANGQFGVDTTLDKHDWPGWLTELVETDGRDWVISEYPR
jgi:hypothetical protein